MALTDKQKKLATQAINNLMRPRLPSGVKDFITLLDENLTGACKNALWDAMKTELLKVKNAEKATTQSEIDDINS